MKKDFFFVITALVVTLQSVAQPLPASFRDRADQLTTILKDPVTYPRYVFVSAHRAGWRFAPENSLEAIRNAIAQGFDIVEIDLKQTRDGHLVLMHDETLDRTTSGSGQVADWTLDSLRTLYLRNPIGTLTAYRIPTLEEALVVAKANILVDLDKSYPYLREAYQIGKKTSTLPQIIFRVNDPYPQFFQKYKDILPYINYMPLFLGTGNSPRTFLSDYFSATYKPTIIEINGQVESEPQYSFIPAVKAQHIRVMMNPCIPQISAGHDDELALTRPDEAWGWLIRRGATILGTDRPDQLILYLLATGQHGQ